MATPSNLYEYYTGQGQSLPSVQQRQGIAQQAGISNYTGTAQQNATLLQYLQNGGSSAPGNSVLNNPSVQSAIQNNPSLAAGVQNLLNSNDPSVISAANAAFRMIDDGTYNKDAYMKEFAGQFDALDPYYRQQKDKETEDYRDTLASKQAGYQNYLDTSAADFQDEKSKQDKTAADNGVLFSGGRYQKLQNLGKQYEGDASLKRAQYTADIGGLGRDYQYKYGNDAAKASGLSQYYNAGGNTYNPNVASGGVGSSGLSSVYNPNSLNLYGTNRTAQAGYAGQNTNAYIRNLKNRFNTQNYQ